MNMLWTVSAADLLSELGGKGKMNILFCKTEDK